MKKILVAAYAVFFLASALMGCSEPVNVDTTDENTVKAENTTDSATSEPEPVDNGFPVWKLTLFNRDISEYSVVTSEDATETEKTAASELCKYIEAACGAKIGISSEEKPFEIAVGVTSRDTENVKKLRADLGEEGYLIYEENNRLYITGKTERGTIYGVYSFLEDYIGCRFYARDYEIIHSSQKIEIPVGLNVSFVPAFEFRNPYWRVAAPGDFCAKNKINGYVGHFISASYGDGMVYAGGHVHTMSTLAETASMPCLSDETVYETVLKNVRKQLGATPNADIISVSQNDGGSACSCAKCKAVNKQYGSEMGTVLLFVNRIAREIKDEYPDVMVDTLAYQYTQSPPVGLVPEDNVIIRLCTVSCCFCHTFDTCTAETSVQFMKDIEGWAAICDNLYIWNYDTNFSLYHSPYPNFNVLWGDVQVMRKYNVKGVFVEGNGDTRFNGEFAELRAYMMAKLLWNPDMTEEQYNAYMDDFLEGYYGAGWKYIREYIDKTSDLMTDYVKRDLTDGQKPYAHMGIWLDITRAFAGVTRGDLTFYNEMAELWNKAVQAETDELKLMHIDRSSIQLEYYYQHLIANRMNDQPRVQALYDRFVKYELGWTYPGCELPTMRKTKEQITW